MVVGKTCGQKPDVWPRLCLRLKSGTSAGKKCLIPTRLQDGARMLDLPQMDHQASPRHLQSMQHEATARHKIAAEH
jgi:hypothetical protein